MRFASKAACAACVCLLFIPASRAEDLVLLADVTTNGSIAVFEIDLTAGAESTGIGPVEPRALTAATDDGVPVVCQFIPCDGFDPKTRIAGTLLCRLPERFSGRLHLKCDGNTAKESAAYDGVVRTPDREIIHGADSGGGFPSSVTFPESGKRVEKLRWMDRLYRKETGQFLAAGAVERISEGPLATVIRARLNYGSAEARPESEPAAVYDWIYFHDSPLVYVTAVVRQKTPSAWDELHFMEIHSKGNELPQWTAGDPVATATLAGDDESHAFADFAAFHDGKNAVGVIRADTGILYDGKGFGPYLMPRRHLSWSRWDSVEAVRSAWLWIGTSDDLATSLREAGAAVPKIGSAVATTASLLDRIDAMAKPPEGVAAADPEVVRRGFVAAILQSLGRIDEAQAVVDGELPGAWNLLDAGELQVALERIEGGIVLRGLLDTRTQTELAAKTQPALLEIELCTPLAEENAKDYQPRTATLTSNEGWSEVAVEPVATGFKVVLSNPSDARFAGLKATLLAEADAEKGAVSWSLAVENGSKDWALHRVRFPRVTLREFAGDTRLLVPSCSGDVEPDAGRRGYRFDRLYPNGWCTMPFEALYAPSKGTGLYVGLHDPLGSVKNIQALGDAATASVMLGFDHAVADMRRQGAGFAMSGRGVWRLLRGDWFDASCMYRDWVHAEAKWYPALSAEGRTDTPQWMKELSVWAMLSGTPEEVVPAVKKFQEYLGVPVGVHWYNWHQIPFDNDYPHYFPTKEGFAAGVADLQQAHVHVMPYINGRLWDTHDREAEDFEFTKTALPAATKDEKGAPLTETYNSVETDGNKVALAVMCPSTDLWKGKVDEIISRLFDECGVHGVYVDQVAAASPRLCFDRSHGHPLGGGSWWNEAYWLMFDAIRAKMPPDRMLTTECNADPFTKWFDGFLSWHWQSNGQVPAFSAVYGGAIQMFGRAYRGGETKDLALRMKAGEQLCYGEQIGWLHPNVVDEPENAPFFRKTVRLRHAFRRYFYAGEMARPPRLEGDVPNVSADWKWYPEWVTTPAVLTGAWRLPKENKTVLFLVNVSDEPVTATVAFDAAEYGFERFPIRAEIHTEEGPIETVELKSSAREVTVPPRSAQAWELTQPDPAKANADFRIRDPFILADPVTKKYYLYANAANRTRGVKGWECYVSDDLKRWESPVMVFAPPEGFWADENFWAPEVFYYKDKYWLFGTVFKTGLCRGTQIFVADGPLGPFQPHTDRAITPHDWFALDATLFFEDGKPWTVFCHEWVQIQDGTMEAAPLSEDLKTLADEPKTLFKASDAPWKRNGNGKNFVTDGPCLYRHACGDLLMLWSSFGKGDYTVGIARSRSGKILGPWTQDPEPLYENGGHCMIFQAFTGETLLALHGPNTPSKERLRLFRVEETENGLRLTDYSSDATDASK